MRRTHYIVAILCLMFAYLTVPGCAEIVPAGKCDERTFNGPKVTLRELAAKLIWNVTHVTETPVFSDIDHVVVFFGIKTKGAYMTIDRIVKKDASVSMDSCKLSAGPENEYFINQCIDGQGNHATFRYYVLYFIKGVVVYIYRCIETEGHDIPVDVRFIANLGLGRSRLTDDQRKEIMTLDSTTFSGQLCELPWRIP